MWYRSILEAIGRTPMVELRRITAGLKPTILAKVEYLNPGGSIKDRIALRMIEEAERRGLLRPGGTIVEGTSGNTGMGLALVAAVKGYRCVFTITDKQSQEKIDSLRALGAEVVICPTNVPPEDPRSYYSVALRLSREIPNAYYPNQYDNPANAQAHYETTGPEIWEQTEGRITHFVAGMGTGGTISGVARFLKERNPKIRIIGVDPVGSLYYHYFRTGQLDPSQVRPYLTEGIGEDILPANMDFSLVDEVVQVDDREAFLMARRLARQEGLFVGGSSGSAMAGALRVARQLDERTLLVVLLPDGGNRYLSKLYNDAWMRSHGFLEPAVRLTAADLLRERPPQQLRFVRPGQTVAEAVREMSAHGISQLPVLEETGELLGSVTEIGLLNVLLERPEARTQPVLEYMDPPFPVLSPEAPLTELAALLNQGTAAVLIALQGGAYAILTKTDLLEAITRLHDRELAIPDP
ncbi:MAG: cystathionine beta-synthase [Bacteroidota bacterium]|nr:cystathionine beta-synthase [Rhodothermia bacterium]MDW8285959.1 cystathionine beta-synthase [Bacteroidota bacterium]